MRLYPAIGAPSTVEGRVSILLPPFDFEVSGAPADPATLRLFPELGAPSTATGRVSILATPFSLVAVTAPVAPAHGGTASGWTRGLRFREPEPDWVEQLRQLEAIDEDETALLLILANL